MTLITSFKQLSDEFSIQSKRQPISFSPKCDLKTTLSPYINQQCKESHNKHVTINDVYACDNIITTNHRNYYSIRSDTITQMPYSNLVDIMDTKKKFFLSDVKRKNIKNEYQPI